MGKKVRKTSTETKKEIIQKIERKELTLLEAAQKLGVHPKTIIRWLDSWHKGTFVDRPTSMEKSLLKENQQLKETVGNLYYHLEQLKKTADYNQRMKNGNTSVITAENLDQFLKRAK